MALPGKEFPPGRHRSGPDQEVNSVKLGGGEATLKQPSTDSSGCQRDAYPGIHFRPALSNPDISHVKAPTSSAVAGKAVTKHEGLRLDRQRTNCPSVKTLSTGWEEQVEFYRAWGADSLVTLRDQSYLE